MSLLIETIKVVDGEFRNLFYHEQRMLKSLGRLCGYKNDFHLEGFLAACDVPTQGVFKCRIVYDDVSREIEFIPYEIRPVGSLKIVEHNTISYPFKYKDRRSIDKCFEKRGTCDDVLIVKKGKVTDTSIANIAFSRDNIWYTPWEPLLNGTMRQNLIDHNTIQAEEIAIADIKSFEKFRLINAMLEFEGPEIDVSQIVF